MQVYLDNAATTPIAPEVIDAMLPFLKEHYGNPSAQYQPGRTTRAAVEQSRNSIAGHLGAKSSEIVFTSGGTEANNTAILGAVRDLGVKRIITSRIEHPCVFGPIEWAVKEYSITVDYLEVDKLGKIDLSDLKAYLDKNDEDTLVSVMHANNEVGVLNDIKAIGEICKAHKVLFHSDTVQTMGQYVIDTSDIYIHFLAGAAHKFHGPKGVGFLYTRSGFQVSPFFYGGGQERSKRPGTENVSGIVGMATAMDLAYDNLEANTEHIRQLKAYFLDKLKAGYKDITLNGPGTGDDCITKVLNVSFPPNAQGPLLLFNLDMKGVYASGGSACSSGASKGSHVLEAIQADPNRPAIRFSFSRYTTFDELDFAINRIMEVVN